MAWIKMKDPMGNILEIPDTMYRDVYANNKAYTLVTEVLKQTEKTETKKETKGDADVRGKERSTSTESAKQNKI